MPELKHLFESSLHPDWATFISQVAVRLLLAVLLGGIIGLERELKHRPAGLRTNLSICFGAALFTILSGALAGTLGGDHTRIAAQIIPGIGFIGAGSILHSRGSIQGLTTAATIFVVASIGMAAGGGLFLVAIFATVLALLVLAGLGRVERHWELRSHTLSYNVLTDNLERGMTALNSALDHLQLSMNTVQVKRADAGFSVSFSVDASPKQQRRLLKHLQSATVLQQLRSFEVGEQE